MNFRTTVAALLLAAAPITPAAAQVEWRLSEFANTNSFGGKAGFIGVLEFRNTTPYSAQPISAIRDVNMTLSARARATCVSTPERLCSGFLNPAFIEPGYPKFTGNVDTSTLMTFDGARWQYITIPNDFEDCSFFTCFEYQVWMPGEGVFGCPIPETRGGLRWEYGGRTCDADGFDGWMRVPFQFAGLVDSFTYTPEDFIPVFTLKTYDAPNSYVPEPSTYALFGTGLVILLALRRRQRAA